MLVKTNLARCRCGCQAARLEEKRNARRTIARALRCARSRRESLVARRPRAGSERRPGVSTPSRCLHAPCVAPRDESGPCYLGLLTAIVLRVVCRRGGNANEALFARLAAYLSHGTRRPTPPDRDRNTT